MMLKAVKTSSAVYKLTLFVLTFTTFFLMSYKLFVLDYELADLIPTEGYDVEVNMQVSGHGDKMSLSTYLPISSSHQSVSNERNAPDIFTTQITVDGLNRIASWQAPAVSGTHIVRYNYFVQTEHVVYTIDENISIPKTLPAYLQTYLEPEEGIQVNDPLIEETLDELFKGRRPDTLEALHTVHDYLQN